LGRLNTNEWGQLQDTLDRFEAAWRGADNVDLARFLPPGGHALRLVILHELIKTDLEMRWQRGRKVRLEDYLARFPELGPAGGLPAALVYEEYRIRRRFEPTLQSSTYQVRFPAQYPELQRLLQNNSEGTVSDIASPGPGPAPEVPAPDAGMLPVGGGYRLLQRIGSGGFGEVWRALAPGDVEVAIKVLFRSIDHDEAKRELQSLDIIKSHRHPYLLQTQAYWFWQNRLYIVMELADGSLRDRLKECRKQGLIGVPAADLIRYLHEAAEALDFLHGKGVLHRDIKPDNILLLQGHAKVADFGLARLHQSQQMLTATFAGTPAYMAPEMFASKVIEQSDQYCLAATYAELRLDRRLFIGETPIQLMYHHLQAAPELGPLPEAEQRVLLRALAKQPDQRFPSCLSFIRELEQALPAAVPPSRPATAVPPSRPATAVPPPLPRAPITHENLETLNPSQEPASEPKVVRPPSGWREAVDTAKHDRPPPGGRRTLWWIALGVLLGLVPLALFVPSWFPSGGEDPPRPAIPSDWEVSPDTPVVTDAVGTRYYQGFDLVRDDLHIHFVLVCKTKKGEGDLETFYIMENKVSVAQFRKFAAGGAVTNTEWQKQGFAGPDYPRAEQPVMGVNARDAHRFAQWCKGHLPSRRQWDKAGGRSEPGAQRPGVGPFQGPWDEKDPRQIGVKRQGQGPLDCGRATRDESLFHCRDMAGNGWEWTRDLALGKGLVDHLGKKAEPFLQVHLRGQSFNREKPLYFQDLQDAEDRDTPEVRSWERTAADIGFRVVIDPF
jgi:serine/threonine protein kinase